MPEIPWRFIPARVLHKMSVTQFVVSGDPVPKARPRVTKHSTYTEKRTKDYEEAVGWAYREAGGILHEGIVGLRVMFWRRTRRRVDVDNLLKGIMDGLNGVAWNDDSQVVYLEVYKDRDADEPCAEVEVWAIGCH